MICRPRLSRACCVNCRETTTAWLRALLCLDGAPPGANNRAMKRPALIVAVCLLACAAACRNDPVEQRARLRGDIDSTNPGNAVERREKLRVLLLGAPGKSREPDPHLRAAAAQGLGQIGDADDFEPLREALMGAFADEHLMVRMEAAIALGKLAYNGPADPRRKEVIRALRLRLAFDRDIAGRLLEDEYLVRVAMANSLFALGRRDAAVALYEVALRFYADLDNPEMAVFLSGADEGLADHCVAHVATLAGVTAEQIAEQRRKSDERAAYLAFIADRMAEMPLVPDR